MNLVSPIWLIGLAPWLGVLIYLLRGAHDRANVPFLQLWRGSASMPRQERRWRTPPTAIVLIMIGCLLGLLAASRPYVPRGTARLPAGVIVIIDRGISMSGRGVKDLRFKEATAELCTALHERFSTGDVELIIVPGLKPRLFNLSDLEREIQSLPPTASDTRKLLSEVIAPRLSQKGGDIFVITDQSIPGNDPRLIPIAPHQPLLDVGITRLAVREQPIAQAMIGLRNRSNQNRATLIVSSAGRSIERQIDLPAPGAERNYFVDLPAVGETVEARVVIKDDIDANDTAWAVRENTWPRIEARTQVSPSLQRMIDAYQHARPTKGDSSSNIPILGTDSALPVNSPAIVVATPDREIQPGDIHAQDHPITQHLRWQSLGSSIRIGKPPAGWTPIVSFGNDVVVATNPNARGQAWIGFDAPRWSSTPDYVVFWTNVFDWVGAGIEKPGFAGHPLADWTPEWKLKTPNSNGLWPGLYTRSDGTQRAFNPPAVFADGKPTEDWRRRIKTLSIDQAGTDLTSWLLLTGLACVVAAAIMWRG